MSSQPKAKVGRNLEEGLNEDKDVKMEKARVKEALTCQCCEEVCVCVFEVCLCVCGGVIWGLSNYAVT